MKVSLPVWMTASSSKEHPPMQTHLKWCGCLVSSRCTHSRLESLAPHTLISSSSSNDWMSSPLLSPDGTQRYYQTGTRNGAASSLIGDHKRDTFVEPFRFDDLQIAKYKAQILAHPMYEQMLAAHVGCLRVATPIDYLQTIEAQLSAERQYMQGSRYSKLHDNNRAIVSEEKEQLDRFMTAYIMLLHLFKQQLQEHVHEHAREAVASCWEIEQALLRLTGVSPGEGSGSTMSDDDEETMRAEASLSYHDQEFFEEGDMLGLGPLMPTESERSLMQRVRQELKSEFKQGYKKRIADVREEILRKRRAGKLPSETTAILKKWWNAHSKWPYPTEDEKAQLVHETGLELKQINNWFINQRKRNWHGHPLTSSSLAKICR